MKMKNKGQGPVGIIVGLVVVVFLIGVIAWAFRPLPTGNVVAETGSEQIQTVNYLEKPFALHAWVVSPEGVQLDIANEDKQTYVITNVEVRGCGTTLIGKSIAAGASELFSVSCALTAGNAFDGIILVKYTTEDGTPQQHVVGNVHDVI